jgi:hypothetical protein
MITTGCPGFLHEQCIYEVQCSSSHFQYFQTTPVCCPINHDCKICLNHHRTFPEKYGAREHKIRQYLSKPSYISFVAFIVFGLSPSKVQYFIIIHKRRYLPLFFRKMWFIFCSVQNSCTSRSATQCRAVTVFRSCSLLVLWIKALLLNESLPHPLLSDLLECPCQNSTRRAGPVNPLLNISKAAVVRAILIRPCHCLSSREVATFTILTPSIARHSYYTRKQKHKKLKILTNVDMRNAFNISPLYLGDS